MSSDQEIQKQSEDRSWTEEMREFFHQTGGMRSEDVSRILGDQTKTVYMHGPLSGGQPPTSRPLFE